MADYVTLMGAERVSNAGHEMSSAADFMQRAASSMDATMEMHIRRMNEWLDRFENLVERLETATQNAKGPSCTTK